MIKTLNAIELRVLAGELLPKWESVRSELKLSPKQLYHLIGLKKALESNYYTINEALAMFLTQEGCTPREDGSFVIPPEKMEFINGKLQEMSEQEVEIEYSPILVGESDVVPPAVMESLFDFIELN